jgi:predicted kinase
MQLRATTYAGLTVVPDSVNSLNITRSAWRNVAFDAGVQNFEIELVCSDLGTHRERVEARKVDIPGFQLATWKSALERQHEPWELVDLVVDNAKVPSSRHSKKFCSCKPTAMTGS